jgi:hypothetical protein
MPGMRENVAPEDEQEKRRDGHLVQETMNLLDKPPEYGYIRAIRDFEAMSKQFHDSGKRYLDSSREG